MLRPPLPSSTRPARFALAPLFSAARHGNARPSRRSQGPSRGLAPGKAGLWLGTVASMETWQPPETPRAGGYDPRSRSPVLRSMVWALILAAPVVGYLNKDMQLATANRAMNRYLGPAAIANIQGFLVKSPQRTAGLAVAPPVAPPVARTPPAAPVPVSATMPGPVSGMGARPPAFTPMPAASPVLVPPPAPVARTVSAPAAQGHGTPMPSVQTPRMRADSNELVAVRAGDGHFYFNAMTNGARVPMMFDTGATDVALRPEDAARMGIDVDRLNYSGRASTANGISRYAPIVLESLTVGGITVRDVPASVHRPGALSMNLLGQSFMTRLAGYNVEGDKLILRGR